jgi:hypothetical protein
MIVARRSVGHLTRFCRPTNFQDLRTARLSKVASEPVSELTGWTRSAKGAQIYRATPPSVVLIMTKDGFGTGSLISTFGEVLTNWHVINGYRDVAIVFKPTVEGRALSREDIKLGRVLRYDEIADLALVKVAELPSGRKPIMLGDSSEITPGGEGLNFAISVDEAKRFVTRPGNKPERPICKPKAFSSWRNKANDSTVTAYDLT